MSWQTFGQVAMLALLAWFLLSGIITTISNQRVKRIKAEGEQARHTIATANNVRGQLHAATQADVEGFLARLFGEQGGEGGNYE